jgi:hypothetical protein
VEPQGKGGGAESGQRSLRKRQELTAPIRVVELDEQIDLVEGEGSPRSEGKTEPEFAAIFAGEDRGGPGGERKADSRQVSDAPATRFRLGHGRRAEASHAAAERGAAAPGCSCPIGRQRSEESRIIEGAHRSTLDELTGWTIWADKVIAF